MLNRSYTPGVEVFVIVEGQTEEAFIKRVVAPALTHLCIYIKPIVLSTSRDSAGGAVSWDRFKLNVKNLAKQHPEAVLTTFLDLYGLDTAFPGFDEARSIADPILRSRALQKHIQATIAAADLCPAQRFAPHIQPYEFEALLFADVQAMTSIEPGWTSAQKTLAEVRADFDSPEHINGNFSTKPSKRLEAALNPRYAKTRHGPIAAQKISLEVMERECEHFRDWMKFLRSLANTTAQV